MYTDFSIDTTSMYFKEAKKFPILSQAEEIEIFNERDKYKFFAFLQRDLSNVLARKTFRLWSDKSMKVLRDRTDSVGLDWQNVIRALKAREKRPDWFDRMVKESKSKILPLQHKIMQSNMLLVSAQVKSNAPGNRGSIIVPVGVPLGDVFQEGILGLVRAFEKYDPTKSADSGQVYGKFCTYATQWIKQKMLRYVDAIHPRRIRLPVHVVDNIRYINNLMAAMSQATGVDIEEIRTDLICSVSPDESVYYNDLVMFTTRSSMNMDFADVQRVLGVDGRAVLYSLDAPVYDDEENSECHLGEISDRHPSVNNQVHSLLTQTMVNRVVLNSEFDSKDENSKTLEIRHRQIIQMYYGLNGCPALTLEEIAQKFNCSRERIRQLRIEAESIFKQAFEKMELFPTMHA